MRVYVDIDLEDVLEGIGNDELLDELERRNITLPAVEESKKIEEHIRSLKDDFLLWNDLGMKNEVFEKIMKQFFKETIDEYII